MASPALDEELISLHYYARQQCSRQWVHFMAAMFAEFEERVDPAEADQFLEALGLKMARLLPLRRFGVPQRVLDAGFRHAMGADSREQRGTFARRLDRFSQ